MACDAGSFEPLASKGHSLLESYRGLEVGSTKAKHSDTGLGQDLLLWLLEEADRQTMTFPNKGPAPGWSSPDSYHASAKYPTGHAASDSPTSIATRPPSGRAGRARGRSPCISVYSRLPVSRTCSHVDVSNRFYTQSGTARSLWCHVPGMQGFAAEDELLLMEACNLAPCFVCHRLS